MRTNILGLFGLLAPIALGTPSTKQGIVYIQNNRHLEDDSIWSTATSGVTWYYNYGFTPSPSYSNSRVQYVPMLWGPPADNAATAFLDSITARLKGGENITHVLAFNEPDEGKATGGSSFGADTASEIWIKQLEPLRKLGVKVGAPAVTGSPRGLEWLDDFFDKCDGKCNPDFMPVHWYGEFDGLKSYVTQVMEKYPTLELWVTEWALPHAELEPTQGFFNATREFLDNNDNVTHYAYFGSFRSDVSNIGPNAAMLTQDGKLTDIGSWYLGGVATHNIPKGEAARTLSATPWLLYISIVVANAVVWIL